MTKRWSSTISDLTKTKRQASKDMRRQFAKEIQQADKEPPEAEFDNIDDMLDWLNS